MEKLRNSFTSIEQVTGQYLGGVKKTEPKQENGISFEEILRKKAENSEELRFSKHASMRLEERNIRLTEEQNERLASGVKKADEKGIRESLVMVDSLAFIVNVPNKTVVTAMEKEETETNIFTNIDGAVII